MKLCAICGDSGEERVINQKVTGSIPRSCIAPHSCVWMCVKVAECNMYWWTRLEKHNINTASLLFTFIIHTMHILLQRNNRNWIFFTLQLKHHMCASLHDSRVYDSTNNTSDQIRQRETNTFSTNSSNTKKTLWNNMNITYLHININNIMYQCSNQDRCCLQALVHKTELKVKSKNITTFLNDQSSPHLQPQFSDQNPSDPVSGDGSDHSIRRRYSAVAAAVGRPDPGVAGLHGAAEEGALPAGGLVRLWAAAEQLEDFPQHGLPQQDVHPGVQDLVPRGHTDQDQQSERRGLFFGSGAEDEDVNLVGQTQTRWQFMLFIIRYGSK